jgi:hypothetical protein
MTRDQVITAVVVAEKIGRKLDEDYVGLRSWLVAAARFLTLPVESRPVSRSEPQSSWVVRQTRVDGYVSSAPTVLRRVSIDRTAADIYVRTPRQRR